MACGFCVILVADVYYGWEGVLLNKGELIVLILVLASVFNNLISVTLPVIVMIARRGDRRQSRTSKPLQQTKASFEEMLTGANLCICPKFFRLGG